LLRITVTVQYAFAITSCMANRDGVAGKVARKDSKCKRNSAKDFEKERKRNKINTVKGSNRKGCLTEKE
jgi:hypothetical protein